MMGTGVRMEMVNIQGMAPSGGANEAVKEPPLLQIPPPPTLRSAPDARK